MNVLRRIRQGIRRTWSTLQKQRFHTQWDHDCLLKVLIETWPGFATNDWLDVLHKKFPEWKQWVQLRFVEKRWERDALASQAQVYVSTFLSADFLAQAKALSWVHLALSGVEFLENVDIPAHIKITTAAGISAVGVAEHILGLMIALDRRMDLAFRRQLRWRWDQRGILENIRLLRGRTAGVVGLGNNGRAVAGLCNAVGMRVIGLDKRSDLSVEGVESVYPPEQLPNLLEQADFAVICLPLSKDTRRLIGKKELGTLGPYSYLINVSRGEIVDERALAWALRHRVIAGAALDVLSGEPPSRLHPLRGCPNLIVTPHVAGNIYTFRYEIMGHFVENLKAFVMGEALKGLLER